jgi:hypothetical protein
VTTSDTKPPSPKPEACNKNTPKLSFASSSITANPGEAATYKMIIEGQDTGDCSPRTFKIKAEGPNDNWKIVLAKQPEDVKPGSKGTIDLVVTSPTGATPGNKTITVKLINPNNDVAVTKTVTYVVPGSSTCKVNFLSAQGPESLFLISILSNVIESPGFPVFVCGLTLKLGVFSTQLPPGTTYVTVLEYQATCFRAFPCRRP